MKTLLAALTLCAAHAAAEPSALESLKSLAGPEAVASAVAPPVAEPKPADCSDDEKGGCALRKRFRRAKSATPTELIGEWGEAARTLQDGGWELAPLQDGKRGLTRKNFNIAPVEGDPTVFAAIEDPGAKTYSDLSFSRQDKPASLSGEVTFAQGDIREREGHQVVYECRLEGADDLLCRVETWKSEAGEKVRGSRKTTYEWFARLSKTGREWPGGEG